LEVSGQIHAPVALPPRIGWMARRTGLDSVAEKKHSYIAPAWNWTLVIQLVPSSLYCLHLHGEVINSVMRLTSSRKVVVQVAEEETHRCRKIRAVAAGLILWGEKDFFLGR